MSPIRILVSALLALAALCGHVAFGAEPQGHFSFRSYGAEAGIENREMNHILQDAEGFIWVCAADAVYRFDGERFEHFGPEAGLPSLIVKDLSLDADGRLLLVTPKGVVHWEGSRFVPMPLAGVEGEVQTVRLGADKHLWVGSERGLYQEREPGSFALAVGWPGGEAFRLWMDGPGEVQVISNSRLLLSRSATGTWTRFEAPGRSVNIVSLVRDGEGRLWLGGEGWLGVQRAPGAPIEDRSSLLVGYTSVGRRLREGPGGRVLLPFHGGVLELVGESARPMPLGLPERLLRMRDALVDREGTLWLASMGIHRALGRGLWTVHDPSTGLPASLVWGLMRDRTGTLWVGTDRGLVYGTAERWQPIRGMERATVRDIVMDPAGHIWAGGRNPALARYDPQTGQLRTFGEEIGFTAQYVYQLLLEPDGSLWAATNVGLLHGVPRGDAWAFEQAVKAQQRQGVKGVARDAAGRVWATGLDGLQVLEGGQWHRLGKAEGLRDERLQFVLARRNGRVCVSFEEPLGISCYTYQGGRLENPVHLDRGNGLRNNAVYSINEDPLDRLWVGTGAGIHVVGADGGLEHFGATSGAPGDDFSSNSFLADADGTVWVGTSSGLGRFDGAHYLGQPNPPRVVVLDVLAGSRTLPRPPHETLELQHDEASLVVRFADLGLLDEGNLEHEARLVGLEEWHPVRGQLMRYSALPTGPYRFEVRARNGRGPWSPVAGFDLRVRPAWWSSWWARLLGVALLGALVAGAVRWRGQRLLRRNLELERLVLARTAELERARAKMAQAEKLSAMGQLMARLSHEINNPLTAIHSNLPPVREYFDHQAAALRALRERLLAHPEDAEEVERVWHEHELDFVLQDTPEALEAMRYATERIRSIQADLRAFLRGERPRMEPGDLNRTVHETVELVRRSLPPGAQVWERCEALPRFCFHPGQMGQVLLNLVRNALDAVGEGGEVRVSTCVREGQVELVVADNGPGIPADLRARIFEPFFTTKDMGKGSGLGLAICRQLVTENHGGTLELDTSVARGACFRVRLPMVQSSEPRQVQAA